MRKINIRLSIRPLLLMAGLPAVASAMADQWIAPSLLVDSGNWSQPSYWSPTGVPGNGDGVFVTDISDGGISFSVNYDYDGSALTLATLFLSSDANDNGAPSIATLTIAANTLNASNESIGGYKAQTKGMPERGEGLINQSGGTNNVGNLVLGYQSYGYGVYQLSGTGVLNATNETLGSGSSSANFTQTGGTNTVSGSMGVGGEYSQSLGSDTITGSLTVSGEYSLSGGVLSANSDAFGYSTGDFAQTGGTNTTGTMILGAANTAFSESDNSISAGTTTVSGAMTLGTVTAFSDGMGGTFNLWETGNLTVSGTGTCSAGSVEVTAFSTLTLGGGGGALRTASITLDNDTTDGSSGQFVWTAGTLELTGNMTWDPSGSGMSTFFGSSLTLASGMALKGDESEVLGGMGNFTLTVNLGAANTLVGALVVNNHSVLNLSGGTLAAEEINLKGVNSGLNWTSGTLDITNDLTINPDGGSTTTGAIFGSALTLSGNKMLIVADNETLADTRTNATFTLTLNSAGTNTVGKILEVATHNTLNVSGGTLGANSTTVETSSGRLNYSSGTFTPGAITVSSGGILTVSAANQTFVLSALSIDSTSKLILANDNLIVHNGSPASIGASLKAGFNAGLGYWNGTGGIDSTAAAADTRLLTALGYGPGGTLFQGVNTVSTDVLVKYTYYGDANLDGTVNGADYQQTDAGFGLHLTGWSNGDFNYDGVVDGSDYSLIDNTFNQINATGASPLALVGGSGESIASAGTSAVPEPGSLLIGVGCAGMVLRRRR
jgi:hypothetical protein